MAMNCACYLTCRGLVRARSVTCVVVEFGLKLLVLATLPRVKGELSVVDRLTSVRGVLVVVDN